MAIRIVRLGSTRAPGEGLRIGTVRRPPRGVPKSEFASQNWYDVWYPNLAPSVETMKFAQAALEEGNPPKPHQSAMSLGCYCEDEARCHRSFLRALLAERGAEIAG